MQSITYTDQLLEMVIFENLSPEYDRDRTVILTEAKSRMEAVTKWLKDQLAKIKKQYDRGVAAMKKTISSLTAKLKSAKDSAKAAIKKQIAKLRQKIKDLNTWRKKQQVTIRSKSKKMKADVIKAIKKHPKTAVAIAAGAGAVVGAAAARKKKK